MIRLFITSCLYIVLLSKAPVTCIRCSKIKSSGFFKCGRCGDAFKAQPVVAPTWEKGSGSAGHAPPTKRRRDSDNASSSEKDKIGIVSLNNLKYVIFAGS